MTTVESFLAETHESPDAKLISRGRYQIVPDGEKRPKAHTRITNFAKKLEDEYKLTLWKKRMVLLGAAQRSDITAAALANSDDNYTLNDLAEAAMDAAQANVRRETGTALHRMCERVDAGEDLHLPEPWRADVDAYTKCLADLKLKVDLIEQVVVHPRLGLAGRLDRTVIGDDLFVCDLKTGRDLSESWGSIAIQLALYAGAATMYDPATHTHSPMPKCNQERALVIHLPATEGKATPYWVNLEGGRRGIALTERVLEWRKGTRALATPDQTPFAAQKALREYVVARVRLLIDGGYGGELARAWPDSVPTLKAFNGHTERLLDLILDSCNEVEGRHELPFPHLTDPRIS